MDLYASSLVFASGKTISAKIFVCKAESIKSAQKDLADLVQELGIPETHVLGKRTLKIDPVDPDAYVGAFAVVAQGKIEAGFAVVFARNIEEFKGIAGSGYRHSEYRGIVLTDTMDIKKISEF